MSEPFASNSSESLTVELIKGQADTITARIEDENRNGEGEVGVWVDDDE